MRSMGSFGTICAVCVSAVLTQPSVLPLHNVGPTAGSTYVGDFCVGDTTAAVAGRANAFISAFSRFTEGSAAARLEVAERVATPPSPSGDTTLLSANESDDDVDVDIPPAGAAQVCVNGLEADPCVDGLRDLLDAAVAAAAATRCRSLKLNFGDDAGDDESAFGKLTGALLRTLFGESLGWLGGAVESKRPALSASRASRPSPLFPAAVVIEGVMGRGSGLVRVSGEAEDEVVDTVASGGCDTAGAGAAAASGLRTNDTDADVCGEGGENC